MSLRIWLPLIGNLINNGVNDTILSTTGTSYANDGKIGKCMSFTSNSYILGTNAFLTNSTDDWSYCCWMKLNATTAGQCLFSCRSDASYAGIAIFYYGSKWLVDDGMRWNCTPAYTIAVDTWYHICIVRSKTAGKFLYVNGVLDSYTTTVGTPTVVSTHFAIGGSQNANTTVNTNYLNGYLNDVRVYDHALSPKEISDISKAKVVHYPLNDNSIQQMTNVLSYPTFNTSSSAGGWSHYAQSGATGSYGQNTDKQYIFNKVNTYSHWISNDSASTANYCCYQNKEYNGYRSLCCIVKEENSLPITEDIFYPIWNARSGGVDNYKWTGISPLGDGFYLCKVEGLCQNGTSWSTALYVKAGYKVYISEAYLENGTTACSDIWNYTNRVSDCSGNSYNGTANGSLIMSSNTPRNLYATTFNGTSDSIAITRPFESGTKHPEMTFAFWINRNDYTDATQRMIYNGICQLYLYTDYKLRISWKHDTASSSANNTWAIGLLVPAGEWHHVCVIFNGGVITVYYDGEFYRSDNRSSTGQFMGGAYATTQSIGYNQFGGSLSDFRIYATALSADDVLALYNTPTSIADNGSMLTQGEFVEL